MTTTTENLHPAYDEGYQAFWTGESVNPYPKTDEPYTDYSDWEAGYSRAWEENAGIH